MLSPEIQINPEMVVLARESRGITQQELAARLAVNQGWLSRVENGQRTVSEATLLKLSEVTQYPPEFFQQSDRIYGIDTSVLYHRKRQDVPIKVLNRIHAQVNVRRMQVARMLRGVDLGEIRFCNFDLEEYGGDVAAIAQAVRAYWRIPLGPVQNVIQLIEDAGGIVIPMEFGTPKIDAVSMWPPDTPPLFFINTQSPNDRLRFTLCHEIGHIFMHQHHLNPDIEDQADEFAGSFLMPAQEVRPYLTGLTLQKLAQLKPYWKVSMRALVVRAGQLGLLSDSQERGLWVKLAPYRTKEPAQLDLPFETPSLLQEIIDTYRNDMNYSPSEFGKAVNMVEGEVKETYYRDRHLRVVK